MKKIVVCAIALTLLASTLRPASAIMVIGMPPPPPAAHTTVALGVGGGIAVGIIAAAAILCIYDIWLKVNGLKNWDGSPKVMQVQHHYHHQH